RSRHSVMSRLLQQVFASCGLHSLLGTSVRSAERVDGELKVSLESGEVLRPDIALFAAGRTVNVGGLGLEVAGVKLSSSGAIGVDEQFQTSVEGIYAAGDLIGPSLSSISMEQGRVAACHALGLHFKEKMDPLPVSAVYSIPELAGVGLTEDDAKRQRLDYA